MHPVFNNPVAPYRYLLPNLYLSVTDIANPDLFACSGRTWISLDISCLYEEHCQPSSGSAWPACPKNGNRAPIARGGRGRHNLYMVCHITVTAPPRVGCVFGTILHPHRVLLQYTACVLWQLIYLFTWYRIYVCLYRIYMSVETLIDLPAVGGILLRCQGTCVTVREIDCFNSNAYLKRPSIFSHHNKKYNNNNNSLLTRAYLIMFI